ncbi:hypothetical protein WDU94_002789 [Cyamophila willieti]
MKHITIPPLVGAVFLVLLFHVLVNELNSYLSWDEDCETPGTDVLSCSLLVFLILLWLISSKPKLVKKFGLPLIQAELFLQLLHVLFLCGFFSLRLCDLVPQMAGSWLPCINVFKMVFTLVVLYFGGKYVSGFLDPKFGGGAYSMMPVLFEHFFRRRRLFGPMSAERRTQVTNVAKKSALWLACVVLVEFN